jgi:hypothetical protein
VYDFNLRRLFNRKIALDSAADSVPRLLNIPDDNIDTDVHFVRLALADKQGRVLSTNFYWLPRKPSTYDWSTESEKRHPWKAPPTSKKQQPHRQNVFSEHQNASTADALIGAGEFCKRLPLSEFNQIRHPRFFSDSSPMAVWTRCACRARPAVIPPAFPLRG